MARIVLGIVCSVLTVLTIICFAVTVAKLKDFHDDELSISVPGTFFSQSFDDEDTWHKLTFYYGLGPLACIIATIAAFADAPLIVGVSLSLLVSGGERWLNEWRELYYIYDELDGDDDDVDAYLGGLMGILVFTTVTVLVAAIFTTKSGGGLTDRTGTQVAGLVLIVVATLTNLVACAMFWRLSDDDPSALSVGGVGRTFWTTLVVSVAWLAVFSTSSYGFPTGVTIVGAAAMARTFSFQAYLFDRIHHVFPFSLIFDSDSAAILVGEDTDELNASHSLMCAAGLLIMIGLALIVSPHENVTKTTCSRAISAIVALIAWFAMIAGAGAAYQGLKDAKDAGDDNPVNSWYFLNEDLFKFEFAFMLPVGLLAVVAIVARSNALAAGVLTLTALWIPVNLVRPREAELLKDNPASLADDEDYEKIMGGTLLLLIGAGVSALTLLASFAGMHDRPDGFSCLPLGVVLSVIGVLGELLACVIFWRYAADHFTHVLDFFVVSFDVVVMEMVYTRSGQALIVAVLTIFAIITRNPQPIAAGVGVAIAAVWVADTASDAIEVNANEDSLEDDRLLFGALVVAATSHLLCSLGVAMGLHSTSAAANSGGKAVEMM